MQANLYNNGIDLPFHYEVLDKEGRSVYRCADYEEKGSDEAYQQALELTLYHYGKNHEYEILCRNITAIEEMVQET